MSFTVPLSSIGQHVLADFYGSSHDLLTDADCIEQILCDAAQKAGAKIINKHFHVFGDQLGVTGVLLLKESHMSIHTWPELNYCAIDIFMCGSAQVEDALGVLTMHFEPKDKVVRTIQRGLL